MAPYFLIFIKRHKQGEREIRKKRRDRDREKERGGKWEETAKVDRTSLSHTKLTIFHLI